MNLQATHARALAKVKKVGQAVTFTLELPGELVPTTGRYASPSTTTVSGYAIKVKGDSDQSNEFQGGEATEDRPLNLFFVPSTFGNVPPLGSYATFADERRKVKKTRSIAPAGTAIASYVTLV